MTVYGTKCGVYEANLTAGDEVSSTYEGRHLTFLASEINFGNVLLVVTKGYPVLVGEDIVGVPFITEVNRGDLISIDTEGIWNLSVGATDEDGDVAVVPGDELFINKTSCLLSKNRNKNTHQRFGYALGTVTTGAIAVIAVKVHWNPDDALEMVGTHDVPLSSAHADKIFRQYRYRSTSITGDIRGQYMELILAGALTGSGEAGRNRTWVDAAVATAHGCHDGIEFGAGGSITGLGVGHRATGKFPNRALWGTIAGGMSELWADGASTNFATSMHSIHRFVMDGDAGGRATAQNAWEFANIPTGAGTQYMLDTGQDATASTDGLRAIINGAAYMFLLKSV